MYLSTATREEIEDLVKESEEKNIPLCLRERSGKLIMVSHSLQRLQDLELEELTMNGHKKRKIYNAETVLIPVNKNDISLAKNNFCYEKIIYDVILELYRYDEENKFKKNEQKWKTLFQNNQIQ